MDLGVKDRLVNVLDLRFVIGKDEMKDQCGLVDLRFGVKFDMISQVLPDKC